MTGVPEREGLANNVQRLKLAISMQHNDRDALDSLLAQVEQLTRERDWRQEQTVAALQVREDQIVAQRERAEQAESQLERWKHPMYQLEAGRVTNVDATEELSRLRDALLAIDVEIKEGRDGAPASVPFIEGIVDKALARAALAHTPAAPPTSTTDELVSSPKSPAAGSPDSDSGEG